MDEPAWASLLVTYSSSPPPRPPTEIALTILLPLIGVYCFKIICPRRTQSIGRANGRWTRRWIKRRNRKKEQVFWFLASRSTTTDGPTMVDLYKGVGNQRSAITPIAVVFSSLPFHLFSTLYLLYVYLVDRFSGWFHIQLWTRCFVLTGNKLLNWLIVGGGIKGRRHYNSIKLIVWLQANTLISLLARCAVKWDRTLPSLKLISLPCPLRNWFKINDHFKCILLSNSI